MPSITIDGKQYTVKDGITIIEAIDQAKIDLPRYCYHPGLSIAGNCRICQVEVEKMPRTVIACNTRVAEGMVIQTNSSKAKESQQVVLEFLLANHPLDCPVCDQAGECKLQDYYMEYGLYDPRFNEEKVKKTKKAFSIGPTIMLDQERCILCSRCVRFGDEITKTHDFGIFKRGDHAEINIYPGRELNNKYSGNVADICPVGALTDKDFRFKMRVWYLGSQESICPGCSRGCNTHIEYEKSRPYHLKDARVMRLKPRENPEVNEWWMCDEGRYAYPLIDFNRIQKPKARENGALKEISWDVLMKRIIEKIKGNSFQDAWALIASPQHTNEELYLQKKIFKDSLKWKHLGFFAPGQEGYGDDFLIQKDKNPNRAGASEILQLGKTTEDITLVIEKAKAGQIKGLFIFHHDLAKIYGQDTLNQVRKNVGLIVYEGTNDNPTASAADFVIPAASYAEKEGTFTNFEGRVQRIKKAFEPLGESKPTWQFLSNLAVELGLTLSYNKAEDVFNDLAREVPAFRNMSYKKLGNQGLIWNKV